MKDLKAVLSPLKVSGSLICTIGVFVAGAIVTGAGVAGCFEVLIFGFGAGHLGCSSSLLSSSPVSVSYFFCYCWERLCFLVQFCCWAQLSLGWAYLLVVPLPWAGCTGDCLSVDCPVKIAVAVEVNAFDFPPMVSAGTVAW